MLTNYLRMNQTIPVLFRYFWNQFSFPRLISAVSRYKYFSTVRTDHTGCRRIEDAHTNYQQMNQSIATPRWLEIVGEGQGHRQGVKLSWCRSIPVVRHIRICTVLSGKEPTNPKRRCFLILVFYRNSTRWMDCSGLNKISCRPRTN